MPIDPTPPPALPPTGAMTEQRLMEIREALNRAQLNGCVVGSAMDFAAAFSLLAECSRLRAALAASEAIVNRLPRTADGVPMVAGDIAHHPSGGYICLPGVSGNGPVNMIGGPHRLVVVPSECYSTRELAIAALKGDSNGN